MKLEKTDAGYVVTYTSNVVTEQVETFATLADAEAKLNELDTPAA